MSSVLPIFESLCYNICKWQTRFGLPREVMRMTLYEKLSLAIAALTLIVDIVSALFNG